MRTPWMASPSPTNSPFLIFSDLGPFPAYKEVWRHREVAPSFVPLSHAHACCPRRRAPPTGIHRRRGTLVLPVIVQGHPSDPYVLAKLTLAFSETLPAPTMLPMRRRPCLPLRMSLIGEHPRTPLVATIISPALSLISYPCHEDRNSGDPLVC